MKRTIATFFCIFQVLCMTIPVTAAQGITIKLPDDDESGYPVISITDDRYQDDAYITEALVPENILILGENLFRGCVNLEEIRLHDKLQVIGKNAFENTAYYNNPNNWENGVLYIGNYLIKADPAQMSESCTVRYGTRLIADGAFENCTQLKTIDLPSTVQYVGADAFLNTAYQNNKTNWEGKGLYLGHVLLDFDKSYADAFAIPTHIKTIADGAFASAQVNKITTTDSLCYVGQNAFLDCRQLTSIALGSAVKTLGRGPFRGCSSLKTITVHSQNEHYAVVDGILFDKQLSSIIRCPQKAAPKTAFPTSLRKVEAYAFEGCLKLKTITLPKGSVFVGKEAFSGCENLTAVSLPESLEYIANNAFARTGLTAVSIPDNVSFLGESAFAHCKNLAKVQIGQGVVHLPNGLFDACEKLSQVSLGNNLESINQNAFRSTQFISDPANYQDGLLIISDQYLIRVSKAVVSCTIPSGITCIADGAFSTGCLTELYLPNTLRQIQYNAFKGVPAGTPIYYNGTLKEFRSINTSPWRNFNLHTTDSNVPIWAVTVLSGVLISFTCGILWVNRRKQNNQDHQNTEVDYNGGGL